jgi:dimethylamine/trimethylamine dehydrogenase
MPAAYPHLFAPLAIGSRRAKNRVVFGAHFTMFTEPGPRAGEPGFFGERLGRYLERRAAHDVGIVIAGQAHVHPTTAYQMAYNAVAWDERAVPELARVAAPVKAHGALALLQLAHNGGVTTGRASRLPVWTPSHVVNNFEAPTPLERDDIRELVAHFARSAAARRRRGVRRRRDPRGARLSDPRVPLPDVEPAHRRLRR